MTKSSQKSVKIIYLFWNLHMLKCKEKQIIKRRRKNDGRSLMLVETD